MPSSSAKATMDGFVTAMTEGNGYLEYAPVLSKAMQTPAGRCQLTQFLAQTLNGYIQSGRPHRKKCKLIMTRVSAWFDTSSYPWHNVVRDLIKSQLVPLAAVVPLFSFPNHPQIGMVAIGLQKPQPKRVSENVESSNPYKRLRDDGYPRENRASKTLWCPKDNIFDKRSFQKPIFQATTAKSRTDLLPKSLNGALSSSLNANMPQQENETWVKIGLFRTAFAYPSPEEVAFAMKRACHLGRCSFHQVGRLVLLYAPSVCALANYACSCSTDTRVRLVLPHTTDANHPVPPKQGDLWEVLVHKDHRYHIKDGQPFAKLELLDIYSLGYKPQGENDGDDPTKED